MFENKCEKKNRETSSSNTDDQKRLWVPSISQDKVSRVTSKTKIGPLIRSENVAGPRLAGRIYTFVVSRDTIFERLAGNS